MRITEAKLRQIIREVLASKVPVTLYHGTLGDRVGSIMQTGLRATEGWGGAAKPGVFLSPTVEDATYWAEKARERAAMPSDIAILKVRIPSEETHNLVPRRKSFSLPNDIQYVGSIPPEWISLF
jgi:hypothetical protein